MSGHSKWSTIKRKKGAADAKRGRIFSRLNKEIMLAARAGGGDIDSNIRLRNAIALAKAANMPKDNISRAVKKGTGELEGGQIEEITYEGYGPAGVAVLVEVVTDNRNRTTADVRHAFAKHGGNLGESGCVGWMFDRRGHFVFSRDKVRDLNKFEEVAIENGAEDIKDESSELDVTCAVSDYNTLQEAFRTAGFEPDSAELAQLPQSTLRLEGKAAESMLKLMDALEELDDVQNVWANFDISDEELQANA
jgi:YebC/PmpR family DNA-binding regulatory protein